MWHSGIVFHDGNPAEPLGKIQHLGQMTHSINVDPLDHDSLPGRLHRKNTGFEPVVPCVEGHGQGPPDRPQRTVKSQFPHTDGRPEHRCPDLFRGSQHGQCQGQVIGRAFLPDVRRCHIDHDPLTGNAEPHRLYGSGNALLGFPNRTIGQSYQKEIDARGNICFYSHGEGLYTAHRTTICLYQHT